MTASAPKEPCPECGLEIPGGSVCPGCSLRLALSPEAATPLEARHPPPDGLKGRYFGDYEIRGEIARGGMGVVYRARQLGLNRWVALKMVQPHHLLSDEARLRFRVEIEAVAQLHHPHIVALYESGEREGSHYFTMRLVEGGDLSRFLREPRDIRQLVRLLVKVCRAVHYAHQRGILHRDLKPSNILVDEQGEPHVADFGLAKSLDRETGFTFTASVLGSPNYMAPEQATGKAGPLTTAVDVYGLGAILYHLLAGRPPFQAATPIETLRQVVDIDPVPPRSLRPGADPDLETIALKCLRKQPDERYGSAEDLALDLERWLAGEPIVARPLGAMATAWRWCQRHTGVTVLGLGLIAALAVIAVGTAVGLVRIRQAEGKSADSLREALLREAASLRLGVELGHRENSLRLLQEAAALGGSSGFRERLRDEVIATLARTEFEHEPLPLGDLPSMPRHFAVHPWFEAAAYLDGSNQVTLRNLKRPDWKERLTPDGVTATGLGRFSPDGRHMAVWQSDQLMIYGLQPTVLRIAIPTTNVVYAFHPREPRLLIQTNANEAVTIDLRTGIEDLRWRAAFPRLGGRREGWRLLVFSPDGRRLAAVSENSRLMEILDSASGLQILALTNSASVTTIRWSRSGRTVAVGTGDHRIELWDSVTGALRWQSDAMIGSAVALAFHPREDWLVAACDDDTIRVVDALHRRFVFEHPGIARQIEFSASGDRIGPVLWDGTWGAFRVRPPRELVGFDLNQSDTRLNDARFSPDGRIVAAGHSDMVALSESETGARLRLREEWRMSACAFHPNGGMIVIGSTNGLLRYQMDHPAHGRLTFSERTVVQPGPGWQAFDFSPDGQRFAAYNAVSNAVYVFDATMTNVVARAGPHTDAGQVAISRDGRWLATGSRAEAGVRVWDLTNGRLAFEAPGRIRPRGLFSPDGKWLVVSDEGRFELREMGTWTESDWVRTNLSARVVGATAFSPDGRFLAVVTDRFAINLFSLAEGRTVGVLRAPSSPVIHALSFSPDSGKLAAVGAESRVSIWDLRAIRDRLSRLGLDRGW